jgi:protein-tyrosine phosphatase
MQNILVICIGNICRSPMAEALLKRELPGKTIRSAGLGALIGSPADPAAVQLMEEEGIDIREHRGQMISARLVQEADLILVMEQDQKRYIEAHYAGSRGKVFRLCEADGLDVADPYREGMDSFRKAHRLIVAGVKQFAKRILQLS